MRLKTVVGCFVLLLIISGCGSSGADSGSSDQDSSQKTSQETGETPEELPDLEPLAARDSSAGKHKLKLELYPVQRSGKLATVNFLVTNTGDEGRFQVADAFSDANYDAGDASGHAADGVQLLDGANAKVYLAATDGKGQCLCSRGLAGAFIETDQSMLFSTTFAAPPKDVTKVDVVIPKFGTFKDVSVVSQ